VDDEKLFVSAIMDVHNNGIVGYQISQTHDVQLVEDSLNQKNRGFINPSHGSRDAVLIHEMENAHGHFFDYTKYVKKSECS